MSMSTPSPPASPPLWRPRLPASQSPSRRCSATTGSTPVSSRSPRTTACSWMSSSRCSPNNIAEGPGMSGSIESGDKDVYDDINITPMLDLAYVLMVIFIIMTTASVQGIKVNLPKASDAPSIAKPQTKAITITADGTMYLDTYPVSLPELETLLRQYKGANPNLPVVVKADSTIPYQKVVDVLDVIGRLEITQLGLVTQRIVK